jgi:hypothetical protein
VIVNDGTGPFTVNLVASNGAVVNTLTDQFAGTITFGAFVPPAGVDSYNAVVTDAGTNTLYIFNSTTSVITVVLPGQGEVVGIGPSSTTSVATSTTTTSITVASTTAFTTTVPTQVGQQHLNASGNNVSTIIGVPITGASTLNLNSGQVYLTINSSSAGYFNITIINVTDNSASPPPGFDKPLALTISISGTVQPKPKLKVLARTRYDCSIPSNSIAPYLISNGTWQPITPFVINSSACTATFNVTTNTTVALLESITHTTTVPTTTTVSASPQSKLWYAAAAAFILIMLALIYLIAKKRRKRHNPFS